MLQAQAPVYTVLGDLRSVRPTANGAMLNAAHGAVLVESVKGVGVRVRIRFSESAARFPTPHSLATGDTQPVGRGKSRPGNLARGFSGALR